MNKNKILNEIKKLEDIILNEMKKLTPEQIKQKKIDYLNAIADGAMEYDKDSYFITMDKYLTVVLYNPIVQKIGMFTSVAKLNEFLIDSNIDRFVFTFEDHVNIERRLKSETKRVVKALMGTDFIFNGFHPRISNNRASTVRYDGLISMRSSGIKRRNRKRR